MKNIIIALVALVCSTAAMAQSNVTIYGTIKETMEFTTKDSVNGRNTNLDSSYSRLGFKATEDLGNGLKAFGAIELKVSQPNSTQAALATETNSFIGNDGLMYVGLSSDKLGLIQAGQFDTLTALVANTTIDKFEGRSFTAVRDVRVGNAVAYVSPSYRGFTAGTAIVANGQNGTATDRPYTDANEYMVRYVDGGLTAGLTYMKVRTANGAAEPKNTFFGASYAFGDYTVNGAYEKDDNGVVAPKNIWTLGGSMQLAGNNLLRAAYRSTEDTSNAYTLEAAHNFSKRTAVYTNYQSVIGKNVNPDVNTLGLGIRHHF